MSWEVVRSETKPCWCGKGAITHALEMDDWSRTRSSHVLDCASCELKQREQEAAQQRRENEKEALYNEARRIAETRYLADWLSGYAGLSKKDAWKRYTGGTGYPSLGTFYKHVQHTGNNWTLANDLETEFAKLIDAASRAAATDVKTSVIT